MKSGTRLNLLMRELTPFSLRAGGAAITILAAAIAGTNAAQAFPEFQTYAEKHSGRTVSCTMCHMNDNGPTGNEEGQLGSLSEKEMERASKARAALEPGQDVDSPILNEFGNHIVKTLGMKKVLELRTTPEKLVEALEQDSDLDKDGIPDAREVADGTDPLNKHHGDPWLLFANNLSRERFHVILAAVSILAIIFGLFNLIKGLHILADRRNRQG